MRRHKRNNIQMEMEKHRRVMTFNGDSHVELPEVSILKIEGLSMKLQNIHPSKDVYSRKSLKGSYV